MVINPDSDVPFSPLIASLLDAFEASGRIKAVLPKGHRDEVASLLTRLMADPDALDGYTAVLKAERRRRGPVVESMLIGMDGLDIPDARIAAEGFGGLSDDHLADIALSPEASRRSRTRSTTQRRSRGLGSSTRCSRAEAASRTRPSRPAGPLKAMVA